jgi:hypothetical protein
MKEIQHIEGKLMIRDYLTIAFLAFMLMATAGADWLDGGYVSSSGSGSEISQYFKDPIFTSPSVGYRSSDPAISEMQSSMDRPVGAGSAASKTAASQQAAQADTSQDVANASGRWSLTLSQGSIINLQLYQSGSRVFGPGSITHSQINKTYSALASGTAFSSSLELDVVSQNGTELYSMIFDLKKLHLSSDYVLFRAGAQPLSGTAMAFKLP